MPTSMAGPVTQAVEKITGRIYTLVLFAIVLAIGAAVIGRKHGGKDRRKGRTTADLAWALGLILFAIFVMPKLFGKA